MGLIEKIFGDADLFNPAHLPAGSPKGGQFAPGKGKTGASRTTADFERSAAHDKGEERMHVTLPDGKTVEIRGGKDRITMPEDALAGKWAGATVSHNHPVTGGSLTPEDVYALHRGKFAEMRAVGEQGGKANVYSARPTEAFHAMMGSRVARAVEEQNAAVMREYKRAIKAGKMTQAQAEADHFHEVWKRVDSALGDSLGYSREVLP